MLDKVKHIIISRIDAIGDVMLTIPMAAYLKQLQPNLKITFLGNTYTLPILKCALAIDDVIAYADWQSLTEDAQLTQMKALKADAIIHVFPNRAIAQLAKRAGITYRVGTNRRLFHFSTCNHLVNLSRKKSELHEAELNLLLLKGLGVQQLPTKTEMIDLYQFQVKEKDTYVNQFLSSEKTNVILHTKSKGSAREWGLGNFAKLIEALAIKQYHIIITGTEEEGKLIRPYLVQPFPHVIDTSGKLTLVQLVNLISQSHILVAASTGPLHIASALGKRAIGLYAPMRPLFPKRWGPIGRDAHAMVIVKDCNACKKEGLCQCIMDIKVEHVLEKIVSR
jgi:heptosyltransferase III